MTHHTPILCSQPLVCFHIRGARQHTHFRAQPCRCPSTAETQTAPALHPCLPAQQNFLLLVLPELPRFIFLLSKDSPVGFMPGLVLTQHRAVAVSHAVLPCSPSPPYASPLRIILQTPQSKDIWPSPAVGLLRSPSICPEPGCYCTLHLPGSSTWAHSSPFC